jgi:hypothetical protein
MEMIAKRTANGAAGFFGRDMSKALGLVAASLMGASMASACGAFAAAPKAGSVASAIKAADIAGRWTGTHHSYGAARAKCDGGPCTLTIDVTACATGWCGVMVMSDGSCGASAMKLEAADGKESYLHFNGKLELAAKAVAYTVQATLWQSADTQERHLDFIGDTGPELMFMRRSFPFQAHLARAGEAVCTSEKATS